jgi:hypothetical protein
MKLHSMSQATPIYGFLHFFRIPSGKLHCAYGHISLMENVVGLVNLSRMRHTDRNWHQPKLTPDCPNDLAPLKQVYTSTNTLP